MPLASLHKLSRSVTRNVETDDDISGNITGFLWVERCFKCKVARLDLSRFIDDGYALFSHFRPQNVPRDFFFPSYGNVCTFIHLKETIPYGNIEGSG